MGAANINNDQEQRPFITAFPVPYSNQGYGMQLRDYFAAQALISIVATRGEFLSNETIAARSYGIADAMMQQRLK
jgi:hypothetical protein